MGEKKRCPVCSSTLIYVRIKSNELVCRYCGKVSKIVKVKLHG